MAVFSPATVARAYKAIAGLLFLTYGVLMIGYFILPDYNLQYKYYIKPLCFLVVPGFVILAAAFKEVKIHPIFQLIVVYMLYTLASGLWSTPFELYKFGQTLTNATVILSFIILTHFLRTWYQLGFDRMLRFSVLLAALSATVSLLVFYSDHHFPSARVSGLGSLTNVNEFANVYGVYALLAMAYGLKAVGLRERALYLLPVIIFLSFIWFGQSRTAFLSLSMALCFLVIANGKREKIRLIVLLVCAVGALGLAYPEALEQAWTRGSGPRPGIWQAFLQDVAQTPVFGRGIISVFSYDIGVHSFTMAHNAYVQTFWHGGIVGLGLLLLLIASACRQAWLLGKAQGDYLILSILLFTMAAMLTGVDTLVARPRDQWMLFWFPLALLISYQTTDRQRSRRIP